MGHDGGTSKHVKSHLYTVTTKNDYMIFTVVFQVLIKFYSSER